MCLMPMNYALKNGSIGNFVMYVLRQFKKNQILFQNIYTFTKKGSQTAPIRFGLSWDNGKKSQPGPGI